MIKYPKGGADKTPPVEVIIPAGRSLALPSVPLLIVQSCPAGRLRSVQTASLGGKIVRDPQTNVLARMDAISDGVAILHGCPAPVVLSVPPACLHSLALHRCARRTSCRYDVQTSRHSYRPVSPEDKEE